MSWRRVVGECCAHVRIHSCLHHSCLHLLTPQTKKPFQYVTRQMHGTTTCKGRYKNLAFHGSTLGSSLVEGRKSNLCVWKRVLLRCVWETEGQRDRETERQREGGEECFDRARRETERVVRKRASEERGERELEWRTHTAAHSRKSEHLLVGHQHHPLDSIWLLSFRH